MAKGKPSTQRDWMNGTILSRDAGVCYGTSINSCAALLKIVFSCDDIILKKKIDDQLNSIFLQ